MNSRRNFLKKLAITSCATLLFKVDSLAVEKKLSKIQIDNTDKSLVFLMLNGGNDSANMLIDKEDEAYKIYKESRPNIALNEDELIEFEVNDSKYAIHYKLKNIFKMFERKELAFVANVGTMIKPIKKETFETTEKPPYLYSHPTQRAHWQSMEPLEFLKTGWGGRISDALDISRNENLPLIYGIGTKSLFLKANNSKAYIFDNAGVIDFKRLRSSNIYTSRKDFFKKINDNTNSNTLVNLYRDLQYSTVEKSIKIENILKQSEIIVDIKGHSTLTKNLMLISKIISLRAEFGLKRQIFYLNTSGYDTHHNQKSNINSLYNNLDTSINTFNEQLKSLGLYNNVLTFIGSDFGRTITSNETGTDHGWGGHYFVFGEAVKGGEVYGNMPSLKLGSSDLTNRHRLIPTTSLEEYLYPICRWFGLNNMNIKEIFPHYEALTNKEDINYVEKKLDFIKDEYLI